MAFEPSSAFARPLGLSASCSAAAPREGRGPRPSSELFLSIVGGPSIFVRVPSEYPCRAPRRRRDPPRKGPGPTPSSELFLSIFVRVCLPSRNIHFACPLGISTIRLPFRNIHVALRGGAAFAHLQGPTKFGSCPGRRRPSTTPTARASRPTAAPRLSRRASRPTAARTTARPPRGSSRRRPARRAPLAAATAWRAGARRSPRAPRRRPRALFRSPRARSRTCAVTNRLGWVHLECCPRLVWGRPRQAGAVPGNIHVAPRGGAATCPSEYPRGTPRRGRDPPLGISTWHPRILKKP